MRKSLLLSALLITLTGLTVVGCAKPAPPPAAAAEPIPLTYAHDVVEGEDYLHYAVGGRIDASPELIWSILTDAAAYPEWNSTIISIDGDIADGETIKLKAHIDPERTFKLSVSTFEPGKKLVWEDGNNMFAGVRTFSLIAVDGGTNFTMREALTGTMLDKIAPKLPDFGPAFDAFMTDLKAEAERRAAAG